MAEAKNYFRILVESINTVIIVKKFTSKELEKVYYTLRRKVTSNTSSLAIMDYHKMVLSYSIKNSDKFLNNLPKGKQQDIIAKVYDTIVAIYPMLSIFNICLDINSDDIVEETMKDMSSLLGFDMKENAEGKVAKLPNANRLLIKNKEDITKLHKFLLKSIIGQNEAVRSVIDCMKLVTSRLAKSSSMFFVGPTGVGKTELAKLLGDKYCGNFFKINCAEYASPHEYAKLIGSPPGYVGHGDKSILSQKAEESNKWVFLFDEIEKADSKFFDFLLSMLDTGTVCDNQGKALDFSESIFIFTSNQGASDIRLGNTVGFSDSKVTYENSLEEVKDSVVRKFPPEFINRIDSFVYFNQLSRDHAKEIAKINLCKLPAKATDSLVEYVVDKAFSVKYGARAIRRFIKTDLMVKLADRILDDGVSTKDRKYAMDFANGEVIIKLEEATASGV